MDNQAMGVAVRILADLRDSPRAYLWMLEFTASLYGCPPETLEQLVYCHLADE